MKTILSLLSVLTLSKAAAASEPTLFELSLPGVVIEQNLAQPKTNPAQLSLQGIVVERVGIARKRPAQASLSELCLQGIVVDDVLVLKTKEVRVCCAD